MNDSDFQKKNDFLILMLMSCFFVLFQPQSKGQIVETADNDPK